MVDRPQTTASCLGLDWSKDRELDAREKLSLRLGLVRMAVGLLLIVVAIPGLPIVFVSLAEGQPRDSLASAVALVSVMFSIFGLPLAAFLKGRRLLFRLRDLRALRVHVFMGTVTMQQLAPREQGLCIRLGLGDDRPHAIEVLHRTGFVWRVDDLRPPYSLVPIARVAAAPARAYAVQVYRDEHVVVARRHLSHGEAAELRGHVVVLLTAGAAFNAFVLAATVGLGYVLLATDYAADQRALVIFGLCGLALQVVVRGVAVFARARLALQLARARRIGKVLVVAPEAQPDQRLELLPTSRHIWRVNDAPAAWRVSLSQGVSPGDGV